LSQGACRGFNARRYVDFRMTWRQAVKLPKFFQLIHWQCIACQMQQGIDQHGAVSV
jgi:hypothetical protein